MKIKIIKRDYKYCEKNYLLHCLMRNFKLYCFRFWILINLLKHEVYAVIKLVSVSPFTPFHFWPQQHYLIPLPKKRKG